MNISQKDSNYKPLNKMTKRPTTAAQNAANPGNDATERVLISRDTARIDNIAADMKKSCEILNTTIARLNAADLLPNGINIEIVIGMIHGDSKPIIANIESALNESTNKSHLMQRVIAQTLESDANIVAGILDDMNKRMNNTIGVRMNPNDRAALVELDNGVVTFNRDKITEYYSVYATPEQQSYINDARELFNAIVRFDHKTRIFSRGNVRGLSTGNTPGFIEISTAGQIFFDAAAAQYLDNLDADPDAAMMPKGTYQIVKPER